MIHVDENNFSSIVLKSAKPVIIDFWASWCMPCQMMGPVFEELSAELTNYLFVKVNTDENPVLSGEFEISGIPCIVILKGGAEVGRIVGFRPKESLKSEILGLLK